MLGGGGWGKCDQEIIVGEAGDHDLMAKDEVKLEGSDPHVFTSFDEHADLFGSGSAWGFDGSKQKARAVLTARTRPGMNEL